MKHASLLRQTVALLPLRFCTCNQDFFHTKTRLVLFVKPFHLNSNQSQFCIHEFPMFVLRPGL